jgi:hypothetical protein
MKKTIYHYQVNFIQGFGRIAQHIQSNKHAMTHKQHQIHIII